jgi:hypothetical protein
MGLPAGTQLGPYEILSAIGAGGMGEVEAHWRRPSRQPKSRAQPGPRAQAGFACAGVEKRGICC